VNREKIRFVSITSILFVLCVWTQPETSLADELRVSITRLLKYFCKGEYFRKKSIEFHIGMIYAFM